jgi:membrane protease subunit HflK
MAWNNQGGGPWGQKPGGGGGPWQRPGGGAQPPNMEEMLRRSQERMKRFFPGGVGGKKPLVIGLAAILLLWAISGFYIVNAAEESVELVFGKWTGEIVGPGWDWNFPWPIGERSVVNVSEVRKVELGFRGNEANGRSAGATQDRRTESLMLTSDQNIVDLDFVVQWNISDLAAYVFTVRDQEQTVRALAESAMREVVGQTALEPLLTIERQEVAQETRLLMQQVLDEYEIGVRIVTIELQDVKPPTEVAEAFEDVQRAQQDKEQLQNQAEAYRNQVVPVARGEATRMIEGATAYQERVIKEAEGEAERFIAIYDTYKNAKAVTRRRLYLEAMEDIMSRADKVIIDQEGGSSSQGVIPYLPLNELRNSRGTGAQ